MAAITNNLNWREEYSRLKGERFEPFPMITLTELIENIKQEQGGVN